MSLFENAGDALSNVGANVLGNATSFSNTVDQFNNQNLSPGDIFRAAQNAPTTLGGLGLGSIIPQLGRIPLPTAGLSNLINLPSILTIGSKGNFESVNYANDLIQHAPKFKFLFKVQFLGFGNNEFYKYVQRCDKPKVKLIHDDINYYNFRTRVLTKVIYDPITISFLDETGNSVNQFFTNYMQTLSGTANGNSEISNGFGSSTSSKPYKNGASLGRQIIVEQIFKNGGASNRFIFSNPKIESFDFDELSMEDNAGSLCNLTFTYDALKCETVNYQTLYSWGQKDILRGGGTSGIPNSGSSSIAEAGIVLPLSATGRDIGGPVQEDRQGDVKYQDNIAGTAITSPVYDNRPDVIGTDLPPFSDKPNNINSLKVPKAYNNEKVYDSSSIVLDKNIVDSIKDINSGVNFRGVADQNALNRLTTSNSSNTKPSTFISGGGGKFNGRGATGDF